MLVVHKTEVLRLGLCHLLDATERFHVSADTGDAPSARELFVQYRPKIAVIGLTLRGGSGIQLIKDFHKLDVTAATLVLSAREDALSIQRALRAGAWGYLLIDDGATEIVRALDEISGGHRYVSMSVLPRLMENFVVGRSDPLAFELNGLSDRELEIFSFMGRGFRPTKLARELHTSPKTIETHCDRIKDKLGLSSAAALREKAEQWVIKSARERLQHDRHRFARNTTSV